MRKLNWLFLIGLIAGTSILGIGAYFLHGFQVRRNASALLDRARSLESEGKLAKAAESLKQYLSLSDKDRETWGWYARLVDESSENDIRLRQQALPVHQEALRHLHDDWKLALRTARIAMELGPRYTTEAIATLKPLSESSSNLDPAAGAEIHELYGVCLRRQGNFDFNAAAGIDGAEQQFEEALKLDPHRVSAYRELAVLQRTDLRQEAKADETIGDMVLKNPESGIAYLYKFRYDNEFRPPAKQEDLRKALELGPDDAEVLLTAGAVRRGEGKLAEARAHFEKGMKLFPKNPESCTALAAVALQEGKSPETEALLREAYKRRPSWYMAYMLARFLIGQGKIEGEGGANEYLELLRTRGLGESYGREIQALIKIQKQDWAGALTDLDAASANLKGGDAGKLAELDRLRAQCQGKLGLDEQNLAGLEKLVGGGTQDLGLQLELSQALLRTGKPGDQEKALRILRVLAVERPELEVDVARIMMGGARRGQGAADWAPVERQVAKAKDLLKDPKKFPGAREAITLLEADMLVARKRAEEARKLLEAADAKDPPNLRYRLALARLAMRDDPRSQRVLQMLDQAERDLGPSPEITMARLDFWGVQGGDNAKSEVARLAEAGKALPESARPAFLDRLALTEELLGDRDLARQHLQELARLQPKNIRILTRLFDFAVDSGDDEEAKRLIGSLFALENPGALETAPRDRLAKGTDWRYAEASYLLGQEIKRTQGDDSRGGKTGSVNLIRVRELADEVAAMRPFWWGGPLIQARIVELTEPDTPEGRPKKIEAYRRVVDIGYSRLTIVLRLLALLEAEKRDAEIKKAGEGNRFEAEIDQIVEKLDRQDATGELSSIRVLNALRKGNLGEGLQQARAVFEDSARYTDHLTLARLYLEAGKPDEAGGEFRRATRLAPSTPVVWEQLVEFLVQTRKPGDARAAIEDARKALPSDRAPVCLARCLAMVGDPIRAEASLQAALKANPTDPAILLFAAQFYFSMNQPGEVMKYLDELTAPTNQAAPDYLAWANRLRATTLMRMGRPTDLAEAMRYLGRNAGLTKDHVADDRLKARILALQQKNREAIDLLTKSKDLPPDDQFLLAQLFLAEKDAKEYENRMGALLKDTKVANPQYSANFIGYLIEAGRLTDAEARFADLREKYPQAPTTLELEVRLLRSKNGGKPTPELRDLLVARGKKNPELIAPVAAELARNGFPVEAEAAFKEFVARGPREPERKLAYVTFLATQNGRAEEAMGLLSESSKTCTPEQVAAAALTLYDSPSVTETQRRQIEAWVLEASRERPDLVGLSNKLAAIWIREGRFEEAEATYRRLLQSNPSNPESLNNLAWLLALRDQKNSEEAVELVDRAIQLQGATASLRDTRAVALIRAGKFPEAIEELNQALASNPLNYNVPLHLAWAHQNLGKTEDARKEFRKAIELGWKADRSDPLERTHITKLRQDLGL